MSGSRIRAGKAEIELGVLDRVSGALNQMESKLRAFADRTRQIGTQLTAAGLAIKAPFALSMKEFATFEQAMANVKAITGATGPVFQALEDKARKLGQTTKFTSTDAARAMYFFSLAGYDANKTLASIGPTLDLAAAGQMDVAEAADIVVKIMAGMGVEAGELNNAVDVLTKGMTTANTDLRQLGDAFKYLGPTAKSAGLTFEETTAAVQLLSNAGIQADMAGTTLRGAIMALTSPSQEAQELMAELGIATQNAQGDFLQLADIIEQFEQKLSGMGSGAQLEVIGRMFDNRQATGIAELIKRGSGELRAATEALRRSSGTAERIAKVQMNTVQGNWELMTSAAQELAITVGEKLSLAFRTLLDAVVEAALWASDFVKQNETILFSAVALGGVLVTLGGTLLTISFAFSTLGAMVAPLAMAMGWFTSTLATVAGIIGTVVTGVAGFVAAWGVWPLVIATVVAGLIDWGKVVTTVKDGVVNSFVAVYEAVTQTVKGVYDALVAGDLALAAQIAMTGIKLAFSAGLTELVEAFGTSIREIAKLLMDLWRNMGSLIAKANELRAGGAGALAKGIGAVVGVDASMEADQMMADAQAWSNSWENVDTGKMVKGIKDALDPAIYQEELNKLMEEAATKRKMAEQEAIERQAYVQPRGAPGTQGPGVIPDQVMKDVGQFAAVGNFSARMVGQQLPNAKKTEQKIADNTKKTADAVITIRDLMQSNPGLLFTP